MNILIIGPIYPYRGGIAHYTGLMAKNLAKSHNVQVVSYSLQYPKLLYGNKEQKDFENDSFRFDNTVFTINTINPFSLLKTASIIKKQAPDLVIFQWWHPFFAPAYRFILSGLGKKSKVLFLCHNVLPHEHFPLQDLLTKWVLRRGNGFIVHSQQDMDDLLGMLPSALVEKAVHPTYNAFKFADISRDEARSVLGIDKNAKVLLFFGFVRKYKGLMHLLRALPQIRTAYPDALLLVVGDFGKDKQEYIDVLDQTGEANSVKIYDGYIPDREVEKYFAASDLVVLPYESATQSGIVQIAYGFEKPVIATAVGGLPEVVLDGQTGYVVPPQNPEVLAQAVVRFFDEDKADLFTCNVRNEAYKYSWDRMNETVEDLCLAMDEDGAGEDTI